MIVPACQTAACIALIITGALDFTPPPLAEMPLFLSWYDPALCEFGYTINCDSDPSVMAGGTAVTPQIYGVAAACIPQWFDRRVFIPGVGERHCLDVGGGITVKYREVYTPDGFVWLWVIYIDILHPHDSPPDWQYSLVWGWGIE